MPTSKRPIPETTPSARLEEGELYSIVGYQVAQAAVSTVATFVRAAGRDLDLRPVEFTILVLVKNNPDVTPSRLAKAIAVKAPNITTWINRLERRGLVQRQASITDKRNQHLRTTREGDETIQKSVERVRKGEREDWPDLSVGERAILVELLHKVARRRRLA
jgi:DNA-binding MarR family transcriptional regulator